MSSFINTLAGSECRSDSSSSSDDTSATSKSAKYILITHGESYVGYTLAIHLAEELTKREGQLKKKHWKVRVLCQSKKNLQELEKRGVEVKEVDYESQSMLREHMNDRIKTCIFNPFPKQKSCFMEQGKNLLESAKDMKIKRIIMVSKVGCSQYENEKGTSLMGKFKVLEENLRSNYKYGHWMIFRVPMIQQFFYFWSKMIEKKSIIGIPISESNMLETVNIRDVCACLSQSALSKKSNVWKNRPLVNTETIFEVDDNNNTGEEQEIYRNSVLKRVYQLTCTKPVNSLMIADAITAALKEEGFDSTVEPVIITEEELKNYLKTIAQEEQDFGEINTGSSTFVSNKEGSNSLFAGQTLSTRFNRPDEPDCSEIYPRPSEFLSPLAIQLIIDYFEYTRSSFIPISPTNDVRDITGCDPVELNEFFMRNRRQF